MGGPQSASRQFEQFTYLQAEVELIQKALHKNCFVLGFCLGAQLIAKALGQAAMQSPHKEVGVFPVHLTSAGKNDAVFQQFPSTFPVVHWHGDMPGLTDGMEILATSEGCPRQAFSYGKKVYGLQFHMEPTRENIQGMAEHCPGDLSPGPYIQSMETLLTNNYPRIHQYMFDFLNRWLQQV